MRYTGPDRKISTPNPKEYIFETIADIWEYLMAGGAVTNLDDSCMTYVYLRDGNPVFNKSGEDFNAFRNPDVWRPYPSILFLKEKSMLEYEIEKLKEQLKSKETYPTVG